MNVPVAKVEPMFLVSRCFDGSPMMFGPHALTWIRIFPGVWFLAKLEKV